MAARAERDLGGLITALGELAHCAQHERTGLQIAVLKAILDGRVIAKFVVNGLDDPRLRAQPLGQFSLPVWPKVP